MVAQNSMESRRVKLRGDEFLLAMSTAAHPCLGDENPGDVALREGDVALREGDVALREIDGQQC